MMAAALGALAWTSTAWAVVVDQEVPVAEKGEQPRETATQTVTLTETATKRVIATATVVNKRVRIKIDDPKVRSNTRVTVTLRNEETGRTKEQRTTLGVLLDSGISVNGGGPRTSSVPQAPRMPATDGVPITDGSGGSSFGGCHVDVHMGASRTRLDITETTVPGGLPSADFKESSNRVTGGVGGDCLVPMGNIVGGVFLSLDALNHFTGPRQFNGQLGDTKRFMATVGLKGGVPFNWGPDGSSGFLYGLIGLSEVNQRLTAFGTTRSEWSPALQVGAGLAGHPAFLPKNLNLFGQVDVTFVDSARLDRTAFTNNFRNEITRVTFGASVQLSR
jgi:hypothetical protein